MSVIKKLNITETVELIMEFISDINASYSVTDFEFFKNPENWSQFVDFFGKNNTEIENIHLLSFKDNFNQTLNNLLKTDLIKIYKSEYEKYKNRPYFNPYTSDIFPFSILDNTSLNRIEFSKKYDLDRELTELSFCLIYRYGTDFLDIETDLFINIGNRIVKKHYMAKPFLKSLHLKKEKFIINKENISKIINSMLMDISYKYITTEDLKVYINNKSEKNGTSDFLLRNYDDRNKLIKECSHYNDSAIINTKDERILIDFEWAYISCLYDDLKSTYEDIIYYDSQENKSLYFTILLYEPPCFIHRLKSYKIVLQDQKLNVYSCDLKNEMKWITKKEKNILTLENIFTDQDVRKNILKTIEEDIEAELDKKINKKIIQERKNKIESDIYNFFFGLDIKITFIPFETMALIQKCSSYFVVNIICGNNCLSKSITEVFSEYESDLDLCAFREKSFINSNLLSSNGHSLKKVKRL